MNTLPIYQFYLVASWFAFLCLSLMWKKTKWLNLFIKMYLLILLLAGTVLIVNHPLVFQVTGKDGKTSLYAK